MPTATKGPIASSAHTTDAEFRAICDAIDDALIDSGLTHTADTGQINLLTVSRPTASSQIMGYKIYKWTDPLDGLEIFMKLEFGNSATIGRFGIAVTYGLGSDGAGNLTSATTRDIPTFNAVSGWTMYAGSSDGGFWCAMASTASNAYLMGANRVRDAEDGDVRPNVLVFASQSTVSPQGFIWNPITLSWGAKLTLTSMFIELGATTHLGGNATDVSMAPGLLYAEGYLRYIDVVAADPDDVTFGTPFVIDMPEGPRTFFPLKGVNISSSTITFCFLWEA